VQVLVRQNARVSRLAFPDKRSLVPAGTADVAIEDFPLARLDPVAGQTTIAFVQSRPNGSGDLDYAYPSCSPGLCVGGRANLLVFDSANGRLIFGVRSVGTGYVYSSTIVISGFPSLFEVQESYQPQPAAWTFRVPVRPEGMGAADHFDTYWGNLAHPLDFAQAHPLACNYPATPPHVGDYLTVADTVPTPEPGQGVYYVTAATYQGATRYGRKTTAGHLSGRDPAALPACGP
jgi:hypothetical protein